MEQYRQMEKDILAEIADLSLRHGPVELRITTEDEDGGFVPEIIITAAPDGVLRGLWADDRIMAIDMDFGELKITPAPEGMDAVFGYGDTPALSRGAKPHRGHPGRDRQGGPGVATAAEAAPEFKKAAEPREDGKVALVEIAPGGAFMLGGHKFVKLDGDSAGTFAVLASTLPDTVAFKAEEGEAARNNYFFSDLRAAIEDWIDGNDEIKDAALERELDLTSGDGMKTYGAAPVRGRSLTIDEYRRFREFIPLTNRWYWLATPWCTAGSPDPDTSFAYYVVTSGALYFSNVNGADFYCPRPALFLQSEIFVTPAE